MSPAVGSPIVFDASIALRWLLPEPLSASCWKLFERSVRAMGRVAAYDSYYLALADSLTCAFWTADRRLFNAAREADLGWVHWIEEER